MEQSLKLKLSKTQVIENIIEYVRSNLQLADIKESHKEKDRSTFFGRGISGKDTDIKFALEIMFNFDYSHKGSSKKNNFENLLSERSSESLKKDRTYTGILFPKSIDYEKAKVEFNDIYFKQARLLEAASKSLNKKFVDKIFQRYGEFNYLDVKDLSRPEWEIAIPISNSKLSYYNPMKKIIQVHDFQSFPEAKIIPENRPLNQAYFWEYVARGFFPPESHGRKAQTFRNIQEGLHDRIRKIIRSTDFEGKFSLESNSSNGANIVKY